MKYRFEGHTRQSKLMHTQVNITHEKYIEIWIDIIKRKIINQSRALSIMGLDGAEKIAEYVVMVNDENVDQNAFNLADDLIEPYRAIVDLIAHNNMASNIKLTKSERRELAGVLHNACIVDGVKVSVMSSIDIMVESLKRIILDASIEKLKLPMILPIESLEGITE